MYTNITELKRQCHIEPTYLDDDQYLQMLLNATEQAVIDYTGAIVQLTGVTGTTLILSGSTGHDVQVVGYSGNHTTVSMAVVFATYLLAAHYYTNRQPISFGQGVEIPLSFKFLLSPYRNNAIA